MAYRKSKLKSVLLLIMVRTSFHDKVPCKNHGIIVGAEPLCMGFKWQKTKNVVRWLQTKIVGEEPVMFRRFAFILSLIFYCGKMSIFYTYSPVDTLWHYYQHPIW